MIVSTYFKANDRQWTFDLSHLNFGATSAFKPEVSSSFLHVYTDRTVEP